MKKNDHAALRRYYRSISSWLPCPGRLKNMVLSNIRVNVEGYIDENPQADIGQIQAHFGEPQDLAASYVVDLDMPKLLKELRVRRRIVTAVIARLLSALLLWGCGVGAAVLEQYSVISGYNEFVVP